MKTRMIKTEKPSFKPVTIELEFESKDEFTAFFMLFNSTISQRQEFYKTYDCSIVKKVSFSKFKEVIERVYELLNPISDDRELYKS